MSLATKVFQCRWGYLICRRDPPVSQCIPVSRGDFYDVFLSDEIADVALDWAYFGVKSFGNMSRGLLESAIWTRLLEDVTQETEVPD